MPGAFAHMSVVDSLSRKPALLANAGRIGEIARYSVKEYVNYCELGSASPDCAFLDFGSTSSKGWGNVMHYWKTADILRQGISFFATKNLEAENHDDLRALAWFFGYASHVATDLTIHPILDASGFGYAANPKEHRHCELQQDAHVFARIKGAEAIDVKYIDNCGISTSCNDPSDPNKVHPAVREVWLYCLSMISPSEVHMTNDASPPSAPPTPDIWFHKYTKRLSMFVEQGGGFPICVRDLFEAEAVFLPQSRKVDPKYIEHLKTKSNQDISYKQAFDLAVANVHSMWEQLCTGINGHNKELFALKNANLDTGEADIDKSQIYVS